MFTKHFKRLEMGSIIFALATTITGGILPTSAFAQNKKALPPTDTFHAGFWFNNPQDAAYCGFTADDPTKVHSIQRRTRAGPFAMIRVPEQSTQLGPLCTDPDPDHPGSCNP